MSSYIVAGGAVAPILKVYFLCMACIVALNYNDNTLTNAKKIIAAYFRRKY